MKQTTKDWLTNAEDDLLAAQKLSGEKRLTNVVSFHCQQCLEKCFKAVIEESSQRSIKSHDLLRLQLISDVQLSESEKKLIAIINEVYIDARYPGDLGLMPQGKPTIGEIESFIKFCEALFSRVTVQLSQ